jgi:hypothetical protein
MSKGNARGLVVMDTSAEDVLGIVDETDFVAALGRYGDQVAKSRIGDLVRRCGDV